MVLRLVRTVRFVCHVASGRKQQYVRSMGFESDTQGIERLVKSVHG